MDGDVAYMPGGLGWIYDDESGAAAPENSKQSSCYLMAIGVNTAHRQKLRHLLENSLLLPVLGLCSEITWDSWKLPEFPKGKV